MSISATLAVGSSWRAIVLGVRWGLGHSAGLVSVAIVFISLKGELDLRTFGRYCDSVVGIFMVLLGIYGVIGAINTNQEKNLGLRKRDLDLTSGKPVSVSPSTSTSASLAVILTSTSSGGSGTSSGNNMGGVELTEGGKIVSINGSSEVVSGTPHLRQQTISVEYQTVTPTMYA
jgi:hypothetical protein